MTASKLAVTRDSADVLAQIVDWLGGVFSAPMSIEAVRACRSSKGEELLDAMGDEIGSTRGLATMRSALESDRTVAGAAASLSACYTRLFDGPGGPMTISLYESTYSGETPHLHRKASTDMEALLRRAEARLHPDFREPADHLCVELALLATFLRTKDRERAMQLQERLMAWTPACTAAIARADSSGLYRGAAIVLRELLAAIQSRPWGSAASSPIERKQHASENSC
jgi:TorA-specific chaperone